MYALCALLATVTVASMALAPSANAVDPGSFGPPEPQPGFVYGIDGSGGLHCYRHNGYLTGDGLNVAGAWKYGNVVGTGWTSLKKVFSGSGAIYGIDASGRLLWYRHNDFRSCAASGWQGSSVVGTGWGGMKNVFGMTQDYGYGGGVIYAIDAQGDLWWYRHNGVGEGTSSWTGRVKVGNGWGSFTKVFAGGNGVIYAIDAKGDLWWYRHDGYKTGAVTWSAPHKVGRGWQSFTKVFSTDDGVIYAVDAQGKLWWYRHNGIATGAGLETPGAWTGGRLVGTGWNAFSQVFLHSPEPFPPLN